MGSIVKRQFEDQVRSLLLQFPTSPVRVAQEASKYFGQEVTVEQVLRIRKKMKAQMDRDTAFWVASNIIQKLFRSTQQRQEKLEAMYANWAGAEQGVVSICCGGPVEKKTDMSGNTYYFCLVCCTDCHVRTARYPEIEKLKMQIVRELRKETELMLKFAKDLGFTVKEPKEVHKHTNFVMVNSPGPEPRRSVPIDAEVAKRLEDMSPSERERMIKGLERMALGQDAAVDTEFVRTKSKEETVGEEAESN